MLDVSIIIVSYNTKNLLKKCLSSIFKFTKGVIYEVIVVDNASKDSTTKMVEDEFHQVELIKNNENVGFGRANNQGSREARGKYLFFFNSDAYLADNVLPKLIKFMDKNKEVGVLGPRILNPDGSIQQSAGFFPDLPQVFFWMSFLDDLPFGDRLRPYHVDHDRFYERERKVDWVTGAAIMIRREVFQKVGGFDKKIFLYGEEVELCLRMKNAGFDILFSPVGKVIHLGRGSFEKSNVGAIVGEYKGLLYFYSKYKSTWQKFLLSLLLKMGAIVRILIFGMIQGRKELKEAYIKAFNLV